MDAYPPTPASRGSASEEQCRLLPRALERWAQSHCLQPVPKAVERCAQSPCLQLVPRAVEPRAQSHCRQLVAASTAFVQLCVQRLF